jgi:hypothetical protein
MSVTNLLLSALIAGSLGAILSRLATGAITLKSIGRAVMVIEPLILECLLAKGREFPLLGRGFGDAGGSGGAAMARSLQRVAIGGQMGIGRVEDVRFVVLHFNCP